MDLSRYLSKIGKSGKIDQANLEALQPRLFHHLLTFLPGEERMIYAVFRDWREFLSTKRE